MSLRSEREPRGLNNKSDDDAPTLLSEIELRSVSKSLSQLIPRQGASQDGLDRHTHIQELLESLLKTASSPNILVSHGVAALDSLCGLLEQCSTSADGQVAAIPYEQTAWTGAFLIFLNSSENHKAKSVRRLLLTLTGLLSKHPNGEAQAALQEYAASTCISLICKENSAASIKPAIQFLEQLLSKKFITAFDVICGVINLDVELGEETIGESMILRSPADFSDPVSIEAAQGFISHVLEWARFPDCAIAISHFLPTFLTSVEEVHSRAQKENGDAASDSQLWIAPVRESLERNPERLEIFEHHVLPNLLRLSSRNVKAFQETLPWKSIQSGDIARHSEADLQLCLLTAKISSSLEVESEYSGMVESPVLHCRKNVFLISLIVAGLEASSARESSLGTETLALSLLDHSCSDVRIAALSLLSSSSKSKKPLSYRTLLRLQECTPYFHQETNPKPRNEFITLMNKLCRRLRSVIVPVLKARHKAQSLENQAAHSINPLLAASDEIETFEQHSDFFTWYIYFLVDELRPTASYQRHITALKLLQSLLDEDQDFQKACSQPGSSSPGIFFNFISPNTLLRPIFDLILDPFDDVRQCSSSIIELLLQVSKFPTPGMNGNPSNIRDYGIQQQYLLDTGAIERTLDRAEAIFQRSGRADHADGMGRLFRLYFNSPKESLAHGIANGSCDKILHALKMKLQKEIDLSKSNLQAAVSNAPLHGHLIALRYIISLPDFCEVTSSSSPGTFTVHWDHVLSYCTQIWGAVQDVLCFDAPEGHNLEEEEFYDTDIGGKETLSFCWRALKESSLLMQAMVPRKSRHNPCLDRTVADEYHHRFVQLAFEQLAKLRHRGAFSTVSQTFALWCVSSTRSDSSTVRDLPKVYYKLALDCIEQQASALTRRSSGIPAMITGILAAYPRGEVFDKVIMDLQFLADSPIEQIRDLNEVRLPQVHALNCLKDIFTDTRFASSTEPFMPNTLDIAASCLDSQVWAIRNCGLMLLKALLTRLNGGADISSSRTTSAHRRFSSLTYQKFPNLPSLILRLLGSHEVHGSEDSVWQAQKVFPALEIVERFGLPPKLSSQVQDAMHYHLEGRVWSVREKAAKALSYVLKQCDIIKEARELLAPGWKTHNALHGRLLCFRSLVTRIEKPLTRDQKTTCERILPLLNDSIEKTGLLDSSPFTSAAFLDVVADIAEILIDPPSQKVRDFAMMHEPLLRHLSSKERENRLNPASLLLRSAVIRCQKVLALIIDTNYGISHTRPEDILRLHEMQRWKTREDLLALLRDPTTAGFYLAAPSLEQNPWGSSKWLPSSPQQSDDMLETYGRQVGLEYVQREGQQDPDFHLRSWTRMVALATKETLDVSTRFAAVISIRGFFKALHHGKGKSNAKSELLGVYLALYDTLVDDDEEVREQSARVTSFILSVVNAEGAETAKSLSLSPPAAKFWLSRLLIDKYEGSPILWMEAVARLVGSTSFDAIDLVAMRDMIVRSELEDRLCIPPVSEMYEEATKEHSVVFEEEKQNLYMDPVKEMIEWTGLIAQMDFRTWNNNTVLIMERWTVEGLVFLLGTFESSRDGPLGVLSKPDVYTLVMRVISVAHVLSIRARQHGLVQMGQLPSLLEEFLARGKQAELPQLVLDTVQKTVRGYDWESSGVKVTVSSDM